jgi:hypothetical protein
LFDKSLKIGNRVANAAPDQNVRQAARLPLTPKGARAKLQLLGGLVLGQEQRLVHAAVALGSKRR